MKLRGSIVLALAMAAGGACASALGANGQGQNPTLVTLQTIFPGVSAYEDQGRVLSIGGAPMNDAATDSEAADAWVRQFVTALDVGQLELGTDLVHSWQGAIGNGKLSAVAYRQYMDGLPVEMSTLRVVVINRPAPLGHFQDTTHHVVLANARLAPRPADGFAADAFTSEQARERVQAVARFANLKEWTDAEQVIYTGEGDFFPSGTAVRAWKFTGADRTDPASPSVFTFFVDCATNEIVFARNEILHADITGSVVGLATPGNAAPSASNPAIQRSINEIKVVVAGTNPEVSAFTDREGNFVIPWTGTDPVSLNISTVNGRWSRIDNISGTEINVTQPNVIPGTPVQININPTDNPAHNSPGLAQINALVHTNITHNFMRDRQPSLNTIDTNILTNVQLAQTCNAFFDPSQQSVNFFSAGGGCANTSFNSVANHEYGHFLVNRRPPVATLQQGAFGEGFSDTISILINDDPIIGEGFFTGQTPTWVRNPATAGRTFPCSGGPHDCGQVLGGLIWDLRNAFVARDGTQPGLALLSQLHSDFYMITQGMDQAGNAFHPGMVPEYLTADDDDGSISNGTPNYGILRVGFIGRGIPESTLPCVEQRASIAILTGVPSFTNSNTPLTYQLRVQNGSEQVQANTVRLEYRLNATGNYTTVLATPTGNNEYSVTMPGIPCGNSVQFRFAVDTTTNTKIIAPIDNTCSGSTYTTAAFDSFTDTLSSFETAGGWVESQFPGQFWTQYGRWAIGVPTGSTGYPAADTSPEPGTKCFLTAAGNPIGSGMSGGATMITSPTMDLSAFNDVTFTYNRWWASNHTGTSTLRDLFRVQVSVNNGTTWTTAEELGPNNSAGGWVPASFTLSGLSLSPSTQIRVRVIAGNLGTGNTLAVAALDDFRVRGTVCNSGRVCDSIDFNNDSSQFDPLDIDAFLSVFSEGPCLPLGATCNDVDFNNDSSLFDPLDIDSFLSVFSEGPCL